MYLSITSQARGPSSLLCSAQQPFTALSNYQSFCSRDLQCFGRLKASDEEGQGSEFGLVAE